MGGGGGGGADAPITLLSLTLPTGLSILVTITSAVEPVSSKPRFTSTVERSFDVVTDCVQATVVGFDGTLVDILERNKTDCTLVSILLFVVTC